MAALSPERAFVVLALLFGPTMLVLTPPLQSPDEHKHFLRAYQISEGELFAEQRLVSKDHRHFADTYRAAGDSEAPASYRPATGALLPKSLWTIRELVKKQRITYKPDERQDLDDLRAALQLPLDSEKRSFLFLASTAMFSPVPYLPQATAIRIGRAAGLGPLALLYLARLANLLVFTGVVFLAIRTIPIFKWTLLLVALTPMSLFLAASPSADTATSALAFLLCALVLDSARNSCDELPRQTLWLLWLTSLLLCLSKPGYAPLLALMLLIPASRFGSARARLLTLALVALTVATAVALWSLHTRSIYLPKDWADPSAQLSFILTQPFEYAEVVARSFAAHGGMLLASFVGILGFLDTPLPSWIYWSYYPVLILACAMDDGRSYVLPTGAKWLSLSIALSSALIFMTMSYVHWTPPHAEVVDGLQGRYFIPIALLFLLPLFRHSDEAPPQHLRLFFSGYAALVLAVACAALGHRYFGLTV